MGWQWRVCEKLMLWSSEFGKCQVNKIKSLMSLWGCSEPVTLAVLHSGGHRVPSVPQTFQPLSLSIEVNTWRAWCPTDATLDDAVGRALRWEAWVRAP